ncbi:hypothetical protein [Paenibacillus sonchi]|nr:hypothetical protein [Paenibacillus sonchi]
MDIRVVPIEQLNAAVYNPRVDFSQAIRNEKLDGSLDEFGY